MTATIERAAGGLVIRTAANGREVLMIHDAYGHLAVPKGHLEAGESWEDAAIREIAEETGIRAHIIGSLGRVEYPIERDGKPIRKQVRLFLLEAIDEADEPVAQEAEVRAAVYLPWAQAKRDHADQGYANWSFIFDKAEALLAWHDADLEQRLRPAPVADFESQWSTAEPIVKQMIAAVREELSVTMPEMKLPPAAEMVLPRAVADKRQALKDAIEHTLLKPEASELDILRITAEAAEHGFRAVCVNPQHIDTVASHLSGTSVIPCVVVGFPLGAVRPDALAAETRSVAAAGAKEIDMVIPFGSAREDDIATVFEHIRVVVEAAHAAGATVKVIFETHFLSFDQVAKCSLAAMAAGADFLKTSTGFAASGARLADVALMRLIAGDQALVKAAGGIRDANTALTFLRFGADRLGTSSGVALIRE